MEEQKTESHIDPHKKLRSEEDQENHERREKKGKREGKEKIYKDISKQSETIERTAEEETKKRRSKVRHHYKKENQTEGGSPIKKLDPKSEQEERRERKERRERRERRAKRKEDSKLKDSDNLDSIRHKEAKEIENKQKIQDDALMQKKINEQIQRCRKRVVPASYIGHASSAMGGAGIEKRNVSENRTVPFKKKSIGNARNSNSGICTTETRNTQYMEGYLLKKDSGVMTSWQPRYCRLEDKKFKFYLNNETKRVAGVLDFEYISCKLHIEEKSLCFL